MDIVRLNVVLQPPPEVVRYAIKLSKELATRGEPYFVLDGATLHPHVTLYQGVYPTHNISSVPNAVRQVAGMFKPLMCTAEKIDCLWGFITVKFPLAPELKQLHEQLVQRLNPMREGHIFAKYLEPEYQTRFNPAQRESVRQYGYPGALHLFNPHLSLIRFKDETLAAEVSRNLKCELKPFTVSELAVYEMGEHGTCTKLVEKFKLGK